MPHLYSIAVPRRPESFAPDKSLKCCIFTHPASLAGSAIGAFAGTAVTGHHGLPIDVDLPDTLLPRDASWRGELHDSLFAKYEKRDWSGLAEIAGAFERETHIQSPRQLETTSSAAIQFYAGRDGRLGAGETRRFMTGLCRDELAEYFADRYWPALARLCNLALARRCLGTLGESRFDITDAIRAMVVFLVARAQLTGDRDLLDEMMPVLRRILCCHVILPGWCFKVDPCDDDERPAIARPASLVRRIAAQNQTDARPQDRRSRDIEAEPSPGGDEAHESDVCRTNRPTSTSDPCCPEFRYFFTDLLQLHERTQCYAAGDMAYIENIAPRSHRKRRHVMSRVEESYSEDETSLRNQERRDLQVSERFSLQTEVDKQIQSSFSASATASASGGMGAGKSGYSWDATGTVSYDRSRSDATRQAQEKARDLVSQSVAEIEKNTRSLRTKRVTTEEREVNVHGFDNTKGDKALVTKYFYVDKIGRAQLFNYGAFLTVEMIIPQPAALYEKLLDVRRERKIDERFARPETSDQILESIGPKPTLPLTLEQITKENYIDIAAQYGADNPPAYPNTHPPKKEPSNRTDGISQYKSIVAITYQVPPEHVAVSAKLTGTVDPRTWLKPVWKTKRVWPGINVTYLAFEIAYHDYEIQHIFGANSIILKGTSKNPQGSTSLPDLEGNQTVDRGASVIKSFHLTVEITFALKASKVDAWKAEVLDHIEQTLGPKVDAWNEKKTAREEKAAELSQKRAEYRQELIEQEKVRHPFYNRSIEQAELKRAVIHTLCGEFSKDGVLYDSQPCGFPEIDRMKARESGDYWYFFDRMFNWKGLTYAFFDYFWNPICDWPDKIDPDEPDALFKAFRRAGYARVLVPVNREMELDFLYYSYTRETWGPGGRPPIDAEDPRWRNVVYELDRTNDAALTARQGYVADVKHCDKVLTIKGTDRYWHEADSKVDDEAVESDVDREIFIDGEVYLVADIQPHPNSPKYDKDKPDQMWWKLTLDRPYQGPDSARKLFSMGAQAVAPAFTYTLPTDLIWSGHEGDCLPCYPLPPCDPETACE